MKQRDQNTLDILAKSRFRHFQTPLITANLRETLTELVSTVKPVVKNSNYGRK
jgi:hypothetical protein